MSCLKSGNTSKYSYEISIVHVIIVSNSNKGGYFQSLMFT